jgi:hypothetical protein
MKALPLKVKLHKLPPKVKLQLLLKVKLQKLLLQMILL